MTKRDSDARHRRKTTTQCVTTTCRDDIQGHRAMMTLLSGMCMRPYEPKRDPRPMSPRPRQDVAASEQLAKTLKLLRVSGASASHGDVFRDVW